MLVHFRTMQKEMQKRHKACHHHDASAIYRIDGRRGRQASKQDGKDGQQGNQLCGQFGSIESGAVGSFFGPNHPKYRKVEE